MAATRYSCPMKQNILTRTKIRKAESLLRENQLAAAKQLCEQIIQADRSDPEALVLLGTVARRLGNHAESESHCRKALQLNPRLAEAHQALGAALQCQGKLPQAVDCYQTAIRLKPELVEAHYLLGNILREHGQLEKAAESYRKVLQLEPEHIPTLCNLGGTLTGLFQYDEAALHLNKANRLRPGLSPVLCNVARVLQLLGKAGEAEKYYREALHHDPRWVDAMVMLSELLEQSNRLEETRELVERGLKLAPGHAGLLLVSAKLARRENRHDEAIAIAETALAGNPAADKKNELHHLLGQLYDRRSDTARAFAHFTEGNRVTASAVADAKRHSYMQSINEHRRQFRAALPLSADRAAQTADRDESSPIFLVGFPRSGTTLLEQILDSHPQLQALDERPTVGALLKAHERIVARRPEAALALADAELKELRQCYFQEADKYVKREPGRTLVDKFPLNLINTYHIWRVFPDAKFILAIRHPCDVCLSCFMQNFALNEAMTAFTNLEDIAGTYAAVMNLWQEFTEHLPLRYHMIRYEDLVENMEDEARRLLKSLDIEWNGAVLGHVEHAKRRGTISTPSYHQVTQPIYKTAKYRWKRYEKELEPVMETLRPFIERFGYGGI